MNRRAQATTAALTLCSLLAFLPSGCLQGAELANEAEFRNSVGCDIEPILASCAGVSCHEGDPATSPVPSGGVDLFTETAPADLVGMPATYPGLIRTDCPDVPELIIDPNNPQDSLLLKKLRNEQSCGDGMPYPFFEALPEAEIACFEHWVQQAIADSAGAN